jgi:hypothetical protein
MVFWPRVSAQSLADIAYLLDISNQNLNYVQIIVMER